MSYDTLVSFLKGGQVDPAALIKSTEYSIFSAARHLHRRLTKDVVGELTSVFLTELYSLKLPIKEEAYFYIYSKTKRLVYSCSNNNKVLSLEEDFCVPEDTSQDTRVTREDLIVPIMDSFLHPSLKNYIISIINANDMAHILEHGSTNTLLGSIIMSALFCKMGRFHAEYRSCNTVEETLPGIDVCFRRRDAEVLFACAVLKISKKWTIPAVILMREAFFLTLLTFLSQPFSKGFKSYFKNIFLSVRVYCFIEALKTTSEDDYVYMASKRFGLRIRDIETRRKRIERALLNYDDYVSGCISQIKSESSKRLIFPQLL